MSPLNFDVSKLPSVEEPWGPGSYTPESLRFNGVPYAPFIKSDKLGKIADWQAIKEEEQPQMKNNGLQKKRDLYHAYGASAAKLFGAETEEKGFSLVEHGATSSTNKQAVLNGHRKRNQAATKKVLGATAKTQAQALKKKVGPSTNSKKQPVAKNAAKWGNNRWGGNKWGGNKWGNDDVKAKESSITVEEDWVSVAEIEFNKLTKLNLDVARPETLSSEGTIHQHFKKYEGSSPVPLEDTLKQIIEQTTSSDPILKEYASKDTAKVFITDAIIAQLMCTPKASASWDIIVTKKNGKIYFDKRPGTFVLPVNEHLPLTDIKESHINHPTKLEIEDSEVSNAYINGSLARNSVKLSNRSPVTASSAIEKGYKYVKFNLPNGASTEDDSQGSIPIIVRASLDAYTYTASANVAIHSLLQYESDDWKTQFTSSQGNMFVDEVRKNNNKLSQWTTQCLLGGISNMKLGFITRSDPKSNRDHVVAGTMTCAVSTLSQQLKLNLNNGWGIVKSFIDIIEHEGGEEDYRFVIFKTPNSQKIIIYKVPFDAFQF